MYVIMNNKIHRTSVMSKLNKVNNTIAHSWMVVNINLPKENKDSEINVENNIYHIKLLY